MPWGIMQAKKIKAYEAEHGKGSWTGPRPVGLGVGVEPKPSIKPDKKIDIESRDSFIFVSQRVNMFEVELVHLKNSNQSVDINGRSVKPGNIISSRDLLILKNHGIKCGLVEWF
ncbi:hypothetical protein CL633_02180 [bacterium]|nr:hypothetical protein [bacterium]|tara:strand:+ start:765 stop:1106 length:342 start_codon:yes stop_codon:yes gene_type:complete